MAVSKRLRYEILRRDNHACRYCGATAPDVKLAVDHVAPVALGGSDEPTNLVAACVACNSGKSSTTPDAALVADIDAKALLWERALTLATERRETRRDERKSLTGYFEGEWGHRYEVGAPMDDDWEETVVRFQASGLNVFDLDEAIDAAYTARIPDANRWKYFCGVCWRKLRQLTGEAHELIETGAVK